MTAKSGDNATADDPSVAHLTLTQNFRFGLQPVGQLAVLGLPLALPDGVGATQNLRVSGSLPGAQSFESGTARRESTRRIVRGKKARSRGFVEFHRS